MAKLITSIQNPLIKNIVSLVTKAGARKEQALFVVEGIRETRLALRGGRPLKYILMEAGMGAHAEIQEIISWAGSDNNCEVIETTTPVFEKIAYRTGVPNLVAIGQIQAQNIQDIKLPEKPLVLVLERLEKPGNLGAILRTADAAGVDLVLVCDPQIELYNPNALRAGLGAIFALPVVELPAKDAVEWLQSKQVKIATTYIDKKSKNLFSTDLRGPLAIVMGSEAQGVSEVWIKAADLTLIIPMFGKVDSMNVSASAAVVLYEAVRQRQKF